MTTATRRFFSRKLAELNEGKTASREIKDLGEELRRSMGNSIQIRAQRIENLKSRAKETEVLRENLKNLYKSAMVVADSLNGLRENLKALNKNISTFRETIEEEDESAALLRDTLGVTFKLHDQMIANCAALGDSLEKTLVGPIQTFVKREVRDSRYFFHELLKAQLDYEASITKLNHLKQKHKHSEHKHSEHKPPEHKHSDLKKSDSLTNQVSVSQLKLDQIAEESILRFNRVFETNILENTRRFMHYLGTLRDFYNDGYIMFQQTKPQLEKIEGNADKRRRDRSGTVEGMQPPVFADAKRLQLAYAAIVDHLSQPKLEIVHSIEKTVTSSEFHHFAGQLARIHHKRGSGPTVFPLFFRAHLLDRPANESKWAVTPLFSDDGVTSHLISLYLKLASRYYLTAILVPSIGRILNESKVLEFEDTCRLFGEFVGKITSSDNICPMPIRTICVGIKEASKDREPLGAVASFLLSFLFLPALSFPDDYCIFDEPISEVGRKNLASMSSLFEQVLGMTEPPVDQMAAVASLNQAYFQNFYEFFSSLSEGGEGRQESISIEGNFQVGLQQSDMQGILLLLSHNILLLAQRLIDADQQELATTLQQLLNQAM